MADPCDPETQSCPPPDSSQMPTQDATQTPGCPPQGDTSNEPTETPDKETPESDDMKTVGTEHTEIDVAEVAAHMVGSSAAHSFGVAGAGLGVAETLYSAYTGDGCTADKAMGIVPLFGTAVDVMMPSWCGPTPQSTNSDTGMTPSQEKAAGYMSPADPNAPPIPVQPHFQRPGN